MYIVLSVIKMGAISCLPCSAFESTAGRVKDDALANIGRRNYVVRIYSISNVFFAFCLLLFSSVL